ncbi:hypothetical protein BASA61_002525 [Batrachochytrium salamandrivorans]|nr:hypothetical protein BASA61_002525 [Batrachochytrium salamandrivorans]
MVALVQVLIAVMLIPVSFAAPSVRIGYSAPDPPKKDPTRQLKVSTNGRCGKKARSRCGEGNCCSQYGFCGTLKDHCGFGCQKPFGLCDPVSPPKHLKLSVDGRCGRGTNLRCRSENCCSQYGFCGDTNEHCRVGCQEFFGLCDPLSPAVQPLV